MFVSDTGLNISKEDDDIQDQAENRPHLTSTNNHCIKKKKNKFMVTNKKKKKKKKEDVSVRESYSTSDHRLSGGDGGGGGNIDFNKPTKVLFFPFNNPNKFFYKKSSPFSPSPSSSSTAAVSGNACFPEYTLLAINLNKLLLLNSVLSASYCYVNCLPLGWRIGVGSSSMIYNIKDANFRHNYW
uniref:Uncharacterized protein n=1 Tax=Populus alba TaxID=43335 RepID=A0A4V6AAP2_POPAL|nr:hypothetical protein D5086_0000087730 [Populus alba]